jgi:hypothetical protein
VGPAGHIVHSGASRARNVDTLFFMLGWDQYGFDKKCTGSRYAELSFLYPVGSASHAVHFGASEERIVGTLFFKHRWDRYRFDKKCFRTLYAKHLFFCIRYDLRLTYCIPVRPWRKTSMHYFSCSGGTGTDSTKVLLEHVTSNFCFCILWDLRVT